MCVCVCASVRVPYVQIRVPVLCSLRISTYVHVECVCIQSLIYSAHERVSYYMLRIHKDSDTWNTFLQVRYGTQ